MAAADRHAFGQIIRHGRLETSQRLTMSWNGSIVESADALLVFFGHSLSSYPPSFFVFLLFRQHPMYEADCDRPLAHCRCDALDIAAPDVTHREHPRQTRF
jgi:hypothetical protein